MQHDMSTEVRPFDPRKLRIALGILIACTLFALTMALRHVL